MPLASLCRIQVHNPHKMRMQGCRWCEDSPRASPGALSLRAGSGQTQPPTSVHFLGLGKTVSCKMRWHAIIFKWNVYGAALGVLTSAHKSLTSHYLPTGQDNLAQTLPFFPWPRIFMEKLCLCSKLWWMAGCYHVAKEEERVIENGIWRN